MFAKRLLTVLVAVIPILAVGGGLAFAAGKGSAHRNGSVHRSGTAARGASDPRLDFGVWTPFAFGRKGSFDFDGAFTFHSRSPVRLKVVDAFCRGDRFRVFDHGVKVFVTTLVAADTEESCAATGIGNPHDTWNDPTYSRGSLLLGAGSHSITIQAIRSPFGAGGAYLKAIRKPGAAS